jgi:hypothetical protein
MRAYGEVDPNKLLDRNNVAKKRAGEPLIITLVHEELHILFPRFGETRICATAVAVAAAMPARQKCRLYRKLCTSGTVAFVKSCLQKEQPW